MAKRRAQPCSTGTEMPEQHDRDRAIALLRAIAHPGRLQVLLALNRLGPMSVSELQRHCGIEQSSMSHQLQVLRGARLVTFERVGKRVIYDLHDKHVAHIVEDALLHACERAA